MTDEQFARLKAMGEPDRWDLADVDEAAVRAAVAEIERLRAENLTLLGLFKEEKRLREDWEGRAEQLRARNEQLAHHLKGEIRLRQELERRSQIAGWDSW